MNKRRIPLLPVFAIVAAGFAAYSLARTTPRRVATTPPSPPPATAFPDAVAATGIIEPSSENIAIGTELSGVVARVHVRAGDGVREGDALFALDARHLEAADAQAATAVDVARSAAGVAQTALDDARRQLALLEAVDDPRAVSVDEKERAEFAVRTAEARLAQARAAVDDAEARKKQTEVEIARSVVRSPIAGRVLRVNVRSGEYAAAGAGREPLMILGDVEPLFVRVDVDEHEAFRIRAQAPATAALRGNADIRTPLRFVRFEPLVIPKRALTGDAAERVDTRVLQALYEIERRDPRFFVGQQVDVFVDAGAAR